MYIKQGIIDHNDIVHYKLNGTRPFKPMSFFLLLYYTILHMKTLFSMFKNF